MFDSKNLTALPLFPGYIPPRQCGGTNGAIQEGPDAAPAGSEQASPVQDEAAALPAAESTSPSHLSQQAIQATAIDHHSPPAMRTQRCALLLSLPLQLGRSGCCPWAFLLVTVKSQRCELQGMPFKRWPSQSSMPKKHSHCLCRLVGRAQTMTLRATQGRGCIRIARLKT